MVISAASVRCFAGLTFAMLLPTFATQEQCTDLQGVEAEEAVDPQIDHVQLLQVELQLKDFKSAEASSGLEGRVSKTWAGLKGRVSKEQPGLATEYIALASTEQCEEEWEDFDKCPNNNLQWMKLTYPAQPFDSIDNLTWSDARGDPALGKWDNMPLGSAGLSCTMRLDGTDEHASKAYALINDFRLGPTGRETADTDHVPGGCCAPTMRVYEKSTGEFSDIDLLAVVREAVDDQPVKWITSSHAFHLDRIDGTLYAFVIVQYLVNQTQDNLGDLHLDAMICLNMDDGKTLIRTKAGLKYFSLFDNLGTFSDDSVYKIRYIRNGTSHPEQWHLNGISRFTTMDGTTVLAFSTIHDNEVVLLRDPWTYSVAERGGEILQRFGTPGWALSAADGVPKRHFGFPASEGHMMQVHGVQHFIQSDGTDWITIFNNAILQDDKEDPTFETVDVAAQMGDPRYESASWRFQVKLVPESQQACGERCGEEVFATNYRHQRLGKYSFAQGGCRPLGNHYGATDVFMCNTLMFGPVFYDGHGRIKYAENYTPMYDSIAHFEVSHDVLEAVKL